MPNYWGRPTCSEIPLEQARDKVNSWIYQMLVMIFGAVSSPCTTNYVLRETVYDNCDDPILTWNYWDSERKLLHRWSLKSVQDEATTIKLLQELTALLTSGGFRLTKWSSSSCEVLLQIPNQEMASPSINLDLDYLPIECSSGLLWNTETDSFRFAVTLCQSALSNHGGLS